MSKRKTIWQGVHEIGLVSIYGEIYGGKDLRKRLPSIGPGSDPDVQAVSLQVTL